MIAFPFPLLKSRLGDRHYYETSSSWHHCSLDIPESTRGRITLQRTIPWVDVETGEHILSIAIMWSKHGRALPSPKEVAEVIWKQLTTGHFERSIRSSLCLFWPKVGPPRSQPAELVRAPIKIKRWGAEVFIRKTDRDLAESLPRDDAIVCLVRCLEWGFRLLPGQWARDQDRFAWVYRQHLKTALIVAEEVAQLYLARSPQLSPRMYLDKAYPELEKLITEAYLPRIRKPRVTFRRLALALVHVKFRELGYPVLRPGRSGLIDSKIWNNLLPPDKRERLIKLRPAPSVRDLLSWSKAKRVDDEVANGFLTWWIRLVYNPLGALYPPQEKPLRERLGKSDAVFAFLEDPGVESFASIVWSALNS